ncbi:F27J15.5 [Arabidopsis thaliana]|nr:F27J15.5 [Arabidopsis thaliana]
MLDDYIAKSKLSESLTSTVWLAKHKLTGEEAVMKCFDLSKLNRNLRDCLNNELEFLSSVDHPNIIRLLHVSQDDDFLVMVLEYCDGGTLSSYIQRYGRVEEDIAKRFMKQIGAGLEIIHDNHIIHRDLKPENILIDGSGDDLVLKIADFSLARKLHPGKYLETVCGSPFYMAPEVLQFQRYNEKADMWSVGAILFELLHGYPPFRGNNNVQVLRNIKSSTALPFSRLILQQMHPDCIDVCSRLLSINPAATLGIEDFPFLGRIKNSRVWVKDTTFSSRQHGTRERKVATINGRLQFDLSQDAYLPQRLLENLMYIYNTIEMARVTGVPTSYLISRGESIKVLSQLLRKAKQKTWFFQMLRSWNLNKELMKVLEARTGFYEPIATLDFASLYS